MEELHSHPQKVHIVHQATLRLTSLKSPFIGLHLVEGSAYNYFIFILLLSLLNDRFTLKKLNM